MSRLRLHSSFRFNGLLLIFLVFVGGAAVVPSASAQSDNQSPQHVIQKPSSPDTSWADLDRLAGRIGSISGTGAFQHALAEHGLVPKGVDTLYSAYPAALRENRIVGYINPRDTKIDVFYENLLGDEEEEGIVQVRSHRMEYFLSFFRKQEGRWHPLPYWIIHSPPHFPAPPEPHHGSCPAGSVCFDFVEALQRGRSLLALQRYEGLVYRGYRLEEELYVYQIRRDSAVRVMRERVRYETEMKSKPWTQHGSRASYRWASSAMGGDPRYLVMKEEHFDIQYEIGEHVGEEVLQYTQLQKSGTEWTVGKLSSPQADIETPKPVRRPSETDLSEAGVAVIDTGRRVPLDGSLRAFVDRLRQTEHPDSLTAQLLRHGLMSSAGGEKASAVRNPDSVHVDLFPVDLFGDELREAVVQVRAGGEAYRLAFFEAVPGGWERLPGVVQVQSSHEGMQCPGGFCFSFVEAQAEGKTLVNGRVERADDRTNWVPIQVTEEGPVLLAQIVIPEGTRIDWAGSREEAFPKDGLLRVPLNRADPVQVRTGLPYDSTGQRHRVHVAELDYAGTSREKKWRTSADIDSVWARGNRVGASDEMVYPKLTPITWGVPSAAVYNEPFVPLDELYGRDWLLPESGGTVENVHYNGLEGYLHDIRRAIEHEAWGTLSGLMVPEDRPALKTEQQKAQFSVSLLHLNEDAATLRQVGIDSVSYGPWSVRGAQTAHSEAMVDVYGTVVLNNGVSAQMQLVLDVRQQRVHLVHGTPPIQQFVDTLRQTITDHDWSTLVADLARFEQGVLSKESGVRERAAALLFGGTPVDAVTSVEQEGGEQACTQLYQQRAPMSLLREVQEFRVRRIGGASLHFTVTFQEGRCQARGMVGMDGEDGRLFVTPRRAGTVQLQSVLVSPGPENSGGFGTSVAGIGDITGDGRGDVAIGAPKEDVGDQRRAGQVYILDGKTEAVVDTVWSPKREQSYHFGNAVAGLGDVNGDAVPDLVVGATAEDVDGEEDAGRAYVVSGADRTIISRLHSSSPEEEGTFGSAFASLGDVDGDGRPDVAVGASGETVEGKERAGQVHVVSAADGTVHHTLQSPNPEAYGYFGEAVAKLGDVNGDEIGRASCRERV